MQLTEQKGAPSIVEVSTAAADPRFLGVGSSPYVGDIGGSFLRLLDDPTPNASERQLCRLCAFTIPAGRSARLLRVGQYLEIGQSYPQQAGGYFEATLPVTSPAWAFPDGNVSWMVTVSATRPEGRNVDTAGQPSRMSPNLYALGPAIVYVPGAARYTPPAGGIPPGAPIGSLKGFTDLRYPWQGHHPTLDLQIDGPCTVTFWASVRQTDPALRTTRTLPNGFDPSVLGPEDRFVAQATNAIYTRIGGSMLFQLYPSGPTGRVLDASNGACP